MNLSQQSGVLLAISNHNRMAEDFWPPIRTGEIKALTRNCEGKLSINGYVGVIGGQIRITNVHREQDYLKARWANLKTVSATAKRKLAKLILFTVDLGLCRDLAFEKSEIFPANAGALVKSFEMLPERGFALDLQLCWTNLLEARCHNFGFLVSRSSRTSFRNSPRKNKFSKAMLNSKREFLSDETSGNFSLTEWPMTAPQTKPYDFY